MINRFARKFTKATAKRFAFLPMNTVCRLDEDMLALQEMVRGFAQKEIAPMAEEVDVNDRFPRDLWPQLGELGLLGITAPEEYGGSEMNYTSHCIAMEEISRASGSIGLSYAAHSNLCVNQITRYGNDAQKEKYLPKLCSGEWVGALAMSEAGSGSDVVSMKTTATKKGDKYVLNGTKMWITNASEANVIVRIFKGLFGFFFLKAFF
jgi:isovaleryl-CoA dehydrogenase